MTIIKIIICTSYVIAPSGAIVSRCTRKIITEKKTGSVKANIEQKNVGIVPKHFFLFIWVHAQVARGCV